MRFARTHLLLIGLILLLVVGGFELMSYRAVVKDTPAQGAQLLSSGTMKFEIADTPSKQETGLSNRRSIPDDYGMLFVFPKADRYGFWMKDMLVPIDIIWLSDSGDILLIDHSVSPDTYPHVLYPPVVVRYVLETRAGYAQSHAWDIGTHVAIPAPYGR